MVARDKILKPLVEHYHLTTRAQQRWSDAMDEYAKEIAIGFILWCGKNRYQYKGWDSPMKFFRVDGNVVTSFNENELFQSYLNTLIQ